MSRREMENIIYVEDHEATSEIRVGKESVVYAPETTLLKNVKLLRSSPSMEDGRQWNGLAFVLDV